MIKNEKYFPALTGVRALAAYSVFVHHYRIFPKRIVGTRLFNFFEELHVGVTLFFVLSGFLIAFRYFDVKNFSFRNYMVNRIARIYPMFFLLTSASFVYFHVFDPNKSGVDKYLMNITFFKGFFSEYLFTGIPQSWSLTVEEMFYILAPILFYFIRKRVASLLIIPVFFCMVGLILTSVFSHASFYGFMDSNSLMFSYTFFGRCFEFMTGIGLAYLVKHVEFKNKFGAFTYIGIVAMVVCVFLLSLFRVDEHYGVATTAGRIVNNIALPLFGIILFYYGLLTEKTVISKILSNKFVELLGKSSYIFYLIHMGFLSLMLYRMSVTNPVLIFIIMNIVSIVLFKFVEEPLNHLVRRKFISKSKQRQTAEKATI